MRVNEPAELLELTDAATNMEIMTARGRVEVSLSGLTRVLAAEDGKSAVTQGLLDAIGSEVHWHSSVFKGLLGKRRAYDALSRERRQAAAGSELNPDPVAPGQLPETLATARRQNIDFVNSALTLPEVGNAYGSLSRSEAEADLSDEEVDVIATEALIRSLTPLGLAK